MTQKDLLIVNYCHRNCMPLMNIMRLPESQAFALARQMAEQNKGDTAFHRFADFDNYYYARLETDRALRSQFMALGGSPVQEHPLSFVLQGSDFLDDWFGNGIVTRIPLYVVPGNQISFTFGDSMTTLRERGTLRMMTKAGLLDAISDFNGTPEDFLADAAAKHRYIEVQVWDDADVLEYCRAESMRTGLIDFLLRAKKSTYAGKGSPTLSSRLLSHDFSYTEGDFLYYDTYVGGEKFSGEEVLYVSGRPHWSMNYAGRVLGDGFSGDFLKDALCHVDARMPFRGPPRYSDGFYDYSCEVRGDFGWFQGREEISFKNTVIYEAVFHGTLITG